MTNTTNTEQKLPADVAAIKDCGFVKWASNELSSDFRQLFDDTRIPVLGVRHVRLWGIQVDDGREIEGHERTSIPDEELWEIVLKAKDGSKYEVNSKLLTPALA